MRAQKDFPEAEFHLRATARTRWRAPKKTEVNIEPKPQTAAKNRPRRRLETLSRDTAPSTSATLQRLRSLPTCGADPMSLPGGSAMPSCGLTMQWVGTHEAGTHAISHPERLIRSPITLGPVGCNEVE